MRLEEEGVGKWVRWEEIDREKERYIEKRVVVVVVVVVVVGRSRSSSCSSFTVDLRGLL